MSVYCLAVPAGEVSSWMQTLVNGGLSSESKALMVHGGLATFFFLFWRKYADIVNECVSVV